MRRAAGIGLHRRAPLRVPLHHAPVPTSGVNGSASFSCDNAGAAATAVRTVGLRTCHALHLRPKHAYSREEQYGVAHEPTRSQQRHYAVSTQSAPDNTATASSIGTFQPRQHNIASILIANRGEIALRVARTAARNGIRTTVVYTAPDARSQHALCSPHAVSLGTDPAAYLDMDLIIAKARESGCASVHPGYGFLSENSTFARRCVEAGLIFIGPSAEAMEAMGNKSRSKDIMTQAGVACVPGYHGSNQDPGFLKGQAAEMGYPVLLKAAKGGGGKGMRIAHNSDDFLDQLASAKSEAKSSFGDTEMLVEKYITTPRHIEVQVFADKHGNCVALGERDCSIQRRHQKILEESPAPNLDPVTRQQLWDQAKAAALAVAYEGAGTVEFIFDNDTGQFYFMEMNTRLQVEHPVTEMVTGEDLVQWQIDVAAGLPLPLTQAQVDARIAERGHAIEARIYAENPDMNFVPDSGRLEYLQTPVESDIVRVDAGFVAGDEILPLYDPMISKLIVRGPDRQVALQNLAAALEQYHVAGLVTNIDFIRRVCRSKDFIAGAVETGFIQKHHDELFAPQAVSDEVYIQAALGIMSATTPATGIPQPGWHSTLGPQQRLLSFAPIKPDGTPDTSDSARVTVEARPTTSTSSGDQYNITVKRGGSTGQSTTYTNVTSHGSPNQVPTLASTTPTTNPPLAPSTKVTTYLAQTRLDTTIAHAPSPRPLDEAASGTDMTLFHRGVGHRLHVVPPKWTNTFLSSSPSAAGAGQGGVIAPMPCKILRVLVSAGQPVRKDEALVVIESMKMETTIRSDRDGVVERVVEQGGLCKAGAKLVVFRDPDDTHDTDGGSEAKA